MHAAQWGRKQDNERLKNWTLERVIRGISLKYKFFCHINFNSGKQKQIKILWNNAMLDYIKTNLQIHQSSVSLPLLFVSPAACFGSGMQLMDSSEWQPLKWHYFRSVDKPCVATRLQQQQQKWVSSVTEHQRRARPSWPDQPSGTFTDNSTR